VKRKMRQLTGRSQAKSWSEIQVQLSSYINGWVNYFALADAKGHMQGMDEWLRRRMRQMAWKQWKTPRNRYQKLRARGVSQYWAVRAGGSSLGPWRMSKSPPVHHALSNTYWEKVGMPSFLHQYTFRRTESNRRMRTRMSGGVGGG
jgi:hypothetical protein